MTRAQYLALFLVLAAILSGFELALPTQYNGLGECGGSISYTAAPIFHPTFYVANQPLFSVPQLVVLPGSITTVNMTYRGADLSTQLNLNNEFYGAGANYTKVDFSLGLYDQDQQVLPSSTGVVITHSALIYHSNDSASQIFTIKVTSDAPWSTYPIGAVGCGSDLGGFLLTVGYLPYWQTVYWVFQWSEIAGVLLISCFAVLLVAIGNYFRTNRLDT